MAIPTDRIDLAFALLKKRANSRGASSNISPNTFNIFFPRSELRFFNIQKKTYAETQIVSDSISKWLSDPIWIPIDARGRFNFYTGMNLLHVDSMSGYLPSATTGQIGGFNLTPGSGYTTGTYANQALTGGTGTGASATITVAGGVVTLVLITNPGTGYAVNDNLTATIAGGTGWKIVLTQVTGNIPYDCVRVEKNKVAGWVNSTYQAPDNYFPIYTQYATWFQLYPVNIGMVQLVYLKEPVYSYWGYLLQGNISTLSGLVGGTGYVNSTYTNVPLVNGSGTGALATIVVSGTSVTSVTITNAGKLYAINDVLSASNTFLGASGSGFSVIVTSIINERPVYNSGLSIQPLWSDQDLSTIVDLTLSDIAIAARDVELAGYASNAEQKTE